MALLFFSHLHSNGMYPETGRLLSDNSLKRVLWTVRFNVEIGLLTDCWMFVWNVGCKAKLVQQTRAKIVCFVGREKKEQNTNSSDNVTRIISLETKISYT